MFTSVFNVFMVQTSFLWVTHCDHTSILHRYGNMASQR